MSLRRFEDQDGHLNLDAEARTYISEHAGVDVTRAAPYVPCTDERCILTLGHDGPHYACIETATGWQEARWT